MTQLQDNPLFRKLYFKHLREANDEWRRAGHQHYRDMISGMIAEHDSLTDKEKQARLDAYHTGGKTVRRRGSK